MRLRNVLLGILGLWIFAFAAVPATLAQPILAWNPNNHTWVGVSSSSTNALINPVTGRQLPDTVTITCPLAPVNPVNIECGPVPNDGHTYKVIAVNYGQQNAGVTASCTVNLGVAGALTPIANAVGQITPVSCATALPAATNQQAVVISTPASLSNGQQIDLVVANATAIAGGVVTVTLQVVS